MRIYDYDPTNRHCREGVAVEKEAGALYDTFWGTDMHRLSDAEAASARFRFNTDGFENVTHAAHRGTPQAWLDRAPTDRETITSQHGLQTQWFIRKGSQPDQATRVGNARQKVEDAKAALSCAQRNLQWAEEELATIDPERG